MNKQQIKSVLNKAKRRKQLNTKRSFRKVKSAIDINYILNEFESERDNLITKTFDAYDLATHIKKQLEKELHWKKTEMTPNEEKDIREYITGLERLLNGMDTFFTQENV